MQVSIWLGIDGKLVLDSTFALGSMKDYVTNPDDAFYLVMPVRACVCIYIYMYGLCWTAYSAMEA